MLSLFFGLTSAIDLGSEENAVDMLRALDPNEC
jgi:hypothetical protein